MTELLDLPVPDDRFDFQEDKPMNFICCLTFCEFVFLPFVASIKKSSFRTKRGGGGNSLGLVFCFVFSIRHGNPYLKSQQ